MMPSNANSPRMESLEGRLLLDGASDDISLNVPEKMYEGRPVVVTTNQPDDYWERIRYWDIDWGDGTTTSNWRGSEPLKHVYRLFGIYNAQVTGTRRNGEVEHFSFVADVRNVAPTPKINCVSAAVPNQPMTIAFNPGDSAPPDTLLVSWSIVGQAGLPYTPAGQTEAQNITWTFYKPGKYKIKLVSRDSNGAEGRTTRTLTIAPVVTQPDPNRPGVSNLVVGGTGGNDTITFQDRRSAVEVYINGESHGVFRVAGKLIAYGGDGNDVIAADAAVDRPTAFFGGSGNDTLAGGSGHNALDGGTGKNKIILP